jgi:hypothetical protein
LPASHLTRHSQNDESEALKILFGSWPIPLFGYMPRHNFIALVDAQGNPLRELNGGAKNPDGTFNYLALRGPLTAVETDYSRRDTAFFPEFCPRPASIMSVLAEGDEADMLERWEKGRAAAAAIDNLGLRYFVLGTNSNTVAAALVRKMGIEPPARALARFRSPGGRRRFPGEFA